MKIIIFGASGMIGQALVEQLIKNHEITVVGRDKTKLNSIFKVIKNFASWEDVTAHFLKDFNVIINLAGENIGAKKWDKKQKEKILQSRITTTSKIAELCGQLGKASPKLINASAIGIYGLQLSLLLQQQRCYDEFSALPEICHDFLAQIGRQWEEALEPAIEKHVNVIKLRFSVVLSPKGGVLAKLLPSFKKILRGKK